MRLLLVEDSERLQHSLGTGLRRAGHAVDVTGTGTDGLWRATATAYDVVVLDIMLPGLDGLSVLRQLRERGHDTHVLLLTARDTVEDRVTGLRAGADDYLVKPFAFDELLARVEALGRRQSGRKSPVTRLGADDYLVKPFAPEELDARTDVLVRRANVARTHAIRFGRLDLVQETSEVLLDGKRIEMSPREYELLFILMRAAPRLVAKRKLVDALSERNLELNDAAVELYVSRLRKKLEGTGTAIRTLRGVGYQLAIASAPRAPASEDAG